MEVTATLLREIERLPEDSAAEVLDFVLFLGTRRFIPKPKAPTVKSMFGAFPGIDTDIEKERDKEDRV